MKRVAPKKKTTADWRKTRLARIRALIKQADPKVIEEVKYRTKTNPAGVPVWYHEGMLCTGETYTNHLRLTFSKGNLLKDPEKLFNKFRSIVIHEEDKLNEIAFKNLIREAVLENQKNKNSKRKA